MLRTKMGRLRGEAAVASTALRRLAGGKKADRPFGSLGGVTAVAGPDGGDQQQRRWNHRQSRNRYGAAASRPPLGVGVAMPLRPENDSDGLTAPNLRRPSLLSSTSTRRSFGLYRRPHQRDLYQPPDPNPFDDGDVSPSDLKTADDMEYYDFLTEDYSPPPHGDDFEGRQQREQQDEEERIQSDLEAERKAQAIRDELDQRTGRLWTDPWEITEQDWFEGKAFDDLPDWSKELCSRVSLERVKVMEGGIPTLSALSNLPLPPPMPPHPSSPDPRPYVKHLRRTIRSKVAKAVEAEAEPEIERILSLPTWEEKQDAVDELFETVEETLRGGRVGAGEGKRGGEQHDGDMMEILSVQPEFGDWVEKSLERYLRQVVTREEEGAAAAATSVSEYSAAEGEKEGNAAAADGVAEADDETASPVRSDDAMSPSGPTAEDDDAAVPVFMDLMGGSDTNDDDGGGLNETGVPNIVHPLKSHPKEGVGRMVEEWDLAANKGTKRIMVRRCIRDIAQALTEADQEGGEGVARRIYVKGRRGAGKTAAMVAAVASARASGSIILYLPDGDRLRKLGMYIKPNTYREGKLFDLPVLAQEVCAQLLQSHDKDLEGMVATADRAGKFLSADDIQKVVEDDGSGDIPLADLLRAGSESAALSSGCYGAVVDALMDQTSTSFVVVMDEFNCYFDHGHYFHEAYDPDVRRSIPCEKITLFKPLLDATGLVTGQDRKGLPRGAEGTVPAIKRGAIVFGVSESRAVARRFTTAMTEIMVSQEEQQAGVRVVDVPPFSPLEVEHIISNFEATGIGRLRFDRGGTVMDEQEVAYLRMVSGGIGQYLMDACII